MAAQFGAGGAVDAFVAAFLPISIGANVVAAIASAFVPVFARRVASGESGHDLVRELLGPTLGITAALTALALAATNPILAVFANGYSDEAAALSRSLYLMMLPVLSLAGISAVCAGVLNAHHRYSFVSVGPALVPITVCASLLILPQDSDMLFVAAATTVGYVLYAVAGIVALSRIGIRFWPISLEFTPDVVAVLKGALPLMGSTILLSGTAIVDQVMVASLGEGSAARLSYGNRIVSQITGLATTAIGTVLLPHFASAVARYDRAALVATIRTSTIWLGVAALGATVVLFVGSPLIIDLLYGRGSMTEAAVVDIVLIQRMFAVQLPFVLVGAIFVRLLLAFERGRFLLIGNCVSVGLNVMLNTWLRVHLGAAGIALSTSLVYAFAFVMLVAESIRILTREPQWLQRRGGS